MKQYHREFGLLIVAITVVFFAALRPSAHATGQPAGTPNAMDTTSYAIGHDLGESTLERLRLDGVEYDRDALVRGLIDALENKDPAFSPEDMAASLAVLQRDVATRLANQRMSEDPVFRALAEENLRKSNEFLRQFGEDDSAKRLSKGVMYRAVSESKSRSPKSSDTVVVSFRARLIDGTLIGDEFELTAKLDGMIDGARIAIEAMNIGDRWIVAIPPDQAFGIGGRLPDIGPNQAVLADVTLVEIK